MQAVIATPESDATMGPLTENNSLYKLPVGNRTLIEHTVATLEEIGVDEITINITSNAVRRIFGADRGVDRVETESSTIYFARSRDPMTAGLDDEEPFLYVRGDYLYDSDQLAALTEHDAAVGIVKSREGAHGSVTVKSGSVDDANPGNVPRTGNASAYAYWFPRQAHEWNYGVDPMLVELSHNYQPAAVDMGDSWQPIRYPHQLLHANIAEAGDRDELKESADVATTAATSDVVVGENVTIGPSATVKNAVLMDGVTVESGAYVSDTIVAQDGRIGPNVSTSVHRGDGRAVTLEWSGSKINTDLDRFGSVIGARANLMAGSTALAGSMISTGLTVSPGQIQ